MSKHENNSFEKDQALDLSFIVIGYNEAATLPKCFESVRNAYLSGISYELIYVDGGSRDDSILVAKTSGVDQVLGGDKRRRAAENRNVGLRSAQGRYVQFLDGDMVLDPDWSFIALNFIENITR